MFVSSELFSLGSFASSWAMVSECVVLHLCTPRPGRKSQEGLTVSKLSFVTFYLCDVMNVFDEWGLVVYLNFWFYSLLVVFHLFYFYWSIIVEYWIGNVRKRNVKRMSLLMAIKISLWFRIQWGSHGKSIFCFFCLSFRIFLCPIKTSDLDHLKLLTSFICLFKQVLYYDTYFWG